MNIDFGKIVTNALSALVAAVFVGAAAIVWNAATSVDKRIASANAELKATQEVFGDRLAEIVAKTESNGQELKSINKILSELEATKNKVSYNPNKPFILDEIRKNIDFQTLQQKELKDLTNKIDVRQMQIYEKKK